MGKALQGFDSSIHSGLSQFLMFPHALTKADRLFFLVDHLVTSIIIILNDHKADRIRAQIDKGNTFHETILLAYSIANTLLPFSKVWAVNSSTSIPLRRAISIATN